MKKKLPEYDIAIVGGGAGGVYTAWRMLLEGPDHSPKLKKWKEERGELKIAVFEGSDRIGGRLLSAKAPGIPDIVCEIGGMRYVSNQPLVKSLVENKLKLEAFPQKVAENDNILFVRGKRMKVSDLSKPKILPYKLSKSERKWLKKDVTPKNIAGNFLGYAVEKIFPDILEKKNLNNLREYLKGKEVDGIPLYQIGFWNLIAPHLSHEAYRIAVTAVGYDCLGFNSNAVDAICEYFDSFRPNTKYCLLKDGYDSVIWAMQEQFEKAGGKVKKEIWLESFDNVTLSDGSEGIELQFKGEKSVSHARAVVLAMPQRSLELLDRKGPVLDPKRAPHVQYMMNAVEPIHLYKMFIAYDTPWWENEGVTEGRSLTDIPIRQCYYWGKENGQKNGNTNALIMVYNDAFSSDFWGGLRRLPLGPRNAKTEFSNENFKRKIMPFVESMQPQNEWDKRLYNNWKISEAPKAMVDEMHRELKILHGLKNAPEPLEAAFVDWADDPFGGAVHFWNAGYDSSKILHDIIQPVENVECYICGEAYSTNQTWVEGALETAELVLGKFNIPKPKWLTS